MDESAPQTETLLNYREAADVLGTAVTFVERLVASRSIAAVRLGHYVRIRRSDLNEYIERSRVPAAED